MLATDDVLIAVAQQLEGLDVPRVIDPVLHASDGTPLLERRAWDTLRLRLLPGAALITPNLEEARLLTDQSDPAESREWLYADLAGGLPPYEWGQAGLPKVKPVKYSRGLGFVIDDGK